MAWQWTTSSIILLSTSGLSLAIGLVFFRRRTLPGNRALGGVMVAVCEWALVAGLEAGAVSLDTKILLSTLEYIGSGCVSVLFLLFAFAFSGRDAWMTRPRIATLWAFPVLSVTLAATNRWHHLVWTGFVEGPAGSNAILYQHGPAFFGIIAVIYVFLVVAVAQLTVTAVRRSIVQKRQSIALLIAAVFPVAGGILYVVGITLVPGLNLAPISFVVTGSILAFGIAPLRLFALVPVARDRLVERMTDGVLVIDSNERLVDMNPAAQRLLGLSTGQIGRHARDALSEWPQVVERIARKEESHLEMQLTADPFCYVDIRTSPLRENEERTGCLVVVRDISVRRRAETALQEANRHLQEQVEQINALQREMREQAIRDALTGLFNRRYLDEMVPRLLARATRDGTRVSSIMLDIDHFKRVNDRRGHRAGDELLSRLGRLLSERTRTVDIACRHGGEEFVIILPDTSMDVARQRAEELRRAFRAAAADQASSDEPITLSAGIGVFPRHGGSQDELLHAADRALYAAKAAGRNCVRTADDLD